MATDLHKGKDSHLSVPTASDMEYHLNDLDTQCKGTVGNHYLVVVPCVCTSADDDTSRFKQEGSVRVVDNIHGGKEKDSLFNRIKKAKY